ncbi:hypothetical protein MASR2M117_19560 [Paludibacter sp.]
MKLIKSLIFKIKRKLSYTSKERFVSFLRNQGVKIGDELFITNEYKTILIDLTRPSLVEIGNRVRLNKNLTILTHDAGYYVLRNKYNEFIPQSGKVKIGNNVYFGRNCSVFKGVEIGDNCIIGFGSVVTRSIPANSVAVGQPAKVIATIDEYYEKRKKLCIEEAFAYARSIKERFNRMPVVEDFWEEFPLFVNGYEYDKYPTLPIKEQLEYTFDDWVKNHKAVFNDFDDFLRHAGL